MKDENFKEGTFWYVGIGCGSDLAERTYRDWERLVEIMEMTEEEWDGENQQEQMYYKEEEKIAAKSFEQTGYYIILFTQLWNLDVSF